MAVSKIFKPRRGAKETMSGAKASVVLEKGEFFVEMPGVGVAGHCKAMIGDGSSTYDQLAKAHKYALGETSYDVIEITSNSATTTTTALNDAVSGNTLTVVIGALKQGVVLNDKRITELNDALAEMEIKLGNQVVYSLNGTTLTITTKS